MNRLALLARSALLSGTLASVTSTLALMGLARAEGRGAWQPTNATSHWWHGPGAAGIRRADLSHTATGYATHHAATLFWAVGFHAWRSWRGDRRPTTVLRDALAVSAVAAAIDYQATPRRFTPGWEFVLSREAMAATYGAMAVGLAVGALITRRADNERL